MNSELKKKLMILAKNFKLDLFILFGYRAKGDYNENSDWDFAYFSKNNKVNYLDLFSEIQNIVGENIDLVNLSSDLDPLLRYNILKDNILIYESELGLIDDFYADSVIEYIDFKPYLKLEEEIINKKINNL
jgi:predicted nucleotidyltransferase